MKRRLTVPLIVLFHFVFQHFNHFGSGSLFSVVI